MVGEYHFESRCSEDDQPNRAGRWGNVMPRAKTEILLELYNKRLIQKLMVLIRK